MKLVKVTYKYTAQSPPETDVSIKIHNNFVLYNCDIFLLGVYFVELYLDIYFNTCIVRNHWEKIK